MISIPRFVSQKCVVILVALSAVGCAGARANNSQTSSTATKPVPLSLLLQSYGYTAIPLTHDMSGLYTLHGAVDSTPVTLLFDCGFNGNIAIDRSRADVLGIRGTPGRVSIGAGGSAVTDTTHLSRFTIGTMHFDSQFVSIITDFPVAEGALGARFASTYNAILDYTNDVLYVRDSLRHGSTLQPGSAEHQGDIAIPLMRVARGNPVKVVYIVKVVIDSMPVTLLLDTGAALDIIIDQHRADELRLHTTSTSSTNGVGGSQIIHTGRIAHFTLGMMHLDSLEFSAMEMSHIQQRYQSDSLPKIEGILGAGILKNHGAIIDFEHGMLYLHNH